MDSSSSNVDKKQPSRDYKCPCGKTYLSNAAIFTHIRQKHNGVVKIILLRPQDQFRNQKGKAREEEGHHQKTKKPQNPMKMKHLIIQEIRPATRKKKKSFREIKYIFQGFNRFLSIYQRSDSPKILILRSGKMFRPSSSCSSLSKINQPQPISNMQESALESAYPSF